MARHRSHAQFERARWRLRILGPAWVLSLVLTLPLMGLFAWRLGDTLKHYEERESEGEQPTIEVAWEVANVVFSFIAGTCTIFEMVRFWGEVLTPWTMLFTHVLKVVCGAAIMALDLVVLIQLGDRHYSIVSIGVAGAFLILATGMLIWTIIIYRRVAVHGDYARRSNVKSYGFSDGLDADFGRNRASSIIDKRRLSFSSSRRASLDPAAATNAAAVAAGGSQHPASEMGPLQRTPSYYSHQRDTQFEEYMARRGSYNGKDVEAAMGNEFFGAGSGGAGSPKAGGGRGSPPQQQQQQQHHEEDVVLSSGTVGVNRPGQVTARSLSTTSSHVLVAVPEEAHEGEEEGEDDRRALLGQKRRRSSADLGGPTRESVDIVPKWRQQQ